MPVSPEDAKAAYEDRRKEDDEKYYKALTEQIDDLLCDGYRCWPQEYTYRHAPSTQVLDSRIFKLRDRKEVLNRIMKEYSEAGWFVSFASQGEMPGLRFSERGKGW